MKTNSLRHIDTVVSGQFKYVIKIQLADECGNGHEDFSITADIYRNKGPEGKTPIWKEYGGGCCHDEILAVRPIFKPFVDLHLSDWTGTPMYAVENGFYWYAGWQQLKHVDHHGSSGVDGKPPEKCREILMSHLRISADEADEMAKMGIICKEQMKIAIHEMKLPARWRDEASDAIEVLEILVNGSKHKTQRVQFETQCTKRHWTPPTEAEMSVHLHRVASGWYKPEAIAKRIAEAFEARKKKDLDALDAEFKQRIEEAGMNYLFDKWVINTFGRRHGSNIIYYRHTNTIECNWSRADKLMTKEEFDALITSTSPENLPAGCKFKFNESPRH